MVYSVGSNNNFDFEAAIVKSTECSVHTFDCTVIPKVPRILAGRVVFHRWCLGARDVIEESVVEGSAGSRVAYKTWDTTLRDLNHTKIDLLKIDIEGYEWDVLGSVLTGPHTPYQITGELHFGTFWNSAKLWWAGRLMTAGESALWARRFYDHGYRVAHKASNPRWPMASEITLVQFRC